MRFRGSNCKYLIAIIFLFAGLAAIGFAGFQITKSENGWLWLAPVGLGLCVFASYWLYSLMNFAKKNREFEAKRLRREAVLPELSVTDRDSLLSHGHNFFLQLKYRPS